jgi:hypothetical protein
MLNNFGGCGQWLPLFSIFPKGTVNIQEDAL